jgi:hypothetical protein
LIGSSNQADKTEKHSERAERRESEQFHFHSLRSYRRDLSGDKPILRRVPPSQIRSRKALRGWFDK